MVNYSHTARLGMLVQSELHTDALPRDRWDEPTRCMMSELHKHDLPHDRFVELTRCMMPEGHESLDPTGAGQDLKSARWPHCLKETSRMGLTPLFRVSREHRLRSPVYCRE